ncbi:MAG: hypothetical protein ACRC4N_15645, partial [Gammaproteobacteria bacterium]
VMRKLLVFVALFAISGVSYAQDAQVNRSLSFYLDATSGHLTQHPDGSSPRLFSGNEFEMGVSYSQNFATVPWLSMWVKALVVTGLNPLYVGDGHDAKYLGNDGGVNILPWAQPRAQLGLNFGGWAILAVDTRGLIAQEAYYTLNFGNAGALTFIQVLEFWAFPQALGNGDTEKAYFMALERVQVLDLFALNVAYGISFAPGWRYSTTLGFRFPGVDAHKADSADSAKAFGEAFILRWENQVTWSVTDKFYMWTRIRYDILNTANKDIDTEHQVMLQAGLGYTFDFSAN